MRRYAVDDEVRIALRGQLRDWRKAGLLSTEQERALEADLTTPLRHTGPMFRLGLAGFTVIAGGAAVGLVVVTTNFGSDTAAALAAAALGAAALAVATVLVREVRLYRHGVEEALAMGAVGLLGLSAGLLASQVAGTNSGGAPWFAGMAAVALSATGTYRWFGFQYAAIAAVYAAALLPMASASVAVEGKRLFAALVCAVAYGYATRRRRDADDDVTRWDADVVGAAAAVGVYVALNVFLVDGPFGRGATRAFTWGTWVVTWLLPSACGRAAVADRNPLLLRVAMAMGLASLFTNTPYLGWSRRPWDPMVLGVALVCAALALRRWLATGEGGERHGYTARQLVDSEATTMHLVGLASVAVQPTPTRDVPEPQDPSFSGGRSGGAGAGSEF